MLTPQVVLAAITAQYACSSQVAELLRQHLTQPPLLHSLQPPLLPVPHSTVGGQRCWVNWSVSSSAAKCSSRQMGQHTT
jgi:hypothetical protein